ncbi:hypothetical protein Rpal_3042 [Rhodopseudomonas palustris TIE-1]|uniref:hypothetical protein n=1 Tax=Rhodopseudomonas palustris TaxID=1076 RepID=UPI000164A6A9|nr:hypothetical protein [Rhodopseudomonas palustris]ACF01548.1 hypothetical protein Rpal_3042 [Rhodopseudomonas palustris TIE-1]
MPTDQFTNPADFLILSDGSVSLRNVMRAAHQKARRRAAEYAEWSARQDPRDQLAVPYSQFFAEAIRWAWDRVRITRNLIRERGWHWYQPESVALPLAA